MDDYGIPNDGTDSLAGLDQKQQLLRQQLAQAMAMQSRPQQQGYGLLGGIGAGLANLAGGAVGGIKASQARAGLQNNAQQLATSATPSSDEDIKAAIAQALMGSGAPGPTAQVAPPSMGAAGGALSPNAPAGRSFAMSSGAHPLPISTPIMDPSAEQLGALGMQDRIPPMPMPQTPGGGQPPPMMPQASPATGGAPTQAPQKPMSGIEQLMALSLKDRQQGVRLMAAGMASGDPALSQMGEHLMERSQQERAAVLQQQQAGLQRTNQLEIANKPQMHINPYGQQVYVFDPSTGAARRIDGSGGGPTTPGALGASPRDRMVADQIQTLTDLTNPSKVAPKLMEKLQFGDRIKPLIEQALENGGNMTQEQATELATAFASYVANGGAPAEGQIKELLPPSLQGNLARFSNFLTGNTNGADRTAWLQLLNKSLEREEPVIRANIGDIIQHNLTGLASFDDPRYSARREAIEAELRQHGYLKAPESAAGLSLDAPGNSKPSPHGATVKQGGHIYRWNGTGYVPQE